MRPQARKPDGASISRIRPTSSSGRGSPMISTAEAVVGHGGIPDRREHVRRRSVRSPRSAFQRGTVRTARQPWQRNDVARRKRRAHIYRWKQRHVRVYGQRSFANEEHHAPDPRCRAAARLRVQPDPQPRGRHENQDIWWAAPAASEDGWGINLTHQGATIFASWFTYDSDRAPMWLVVTALQTGPATYTGDLYRDRPTVQCRSLFSDRESGWDDGNQRRNRNVRFQQRTNGSLCVHRERRVASEDDYAPGLAPPGTVCQ